ncbi:MAG: DUF1192 domain-containing protein [Pseudomonadota bacterium]
MDDLEPIRTTRPTLLEDMSVEDLKSRISALEAEIEACRAEIAKKDAHRSAADALFGGDG